MASDLLKLLKDEAVFSAKLFYAPVYGAYRVLRTSLGGRGQEVEVNHGWGAKQPKPASGSGETLISAQNKP
jgi:hypothetical protein